MLLSKKRYTLIGIFLLLGAGCQSVTVSPAALIPEDWPTYTNVEFGFEFRYPPYASSSSAGPVFPDDLLVLDLGTAVVSSTAESVPETTLHVKAISATDPRIHECYYAEQGWAQNAPVPEGELIEVQGRTFCLYHQTDAGLGNLYDVYAYATPVGDQVIVLSFVVHSLQCANFPHPEEQCVPFLESRDTAGFQEIVSTFRVL